VIYHLSALSIPSRCGGNGPPTEEAIASNFTSTQEIIEYLHELSLPTRLVLVSSSHVYAPVTWEQPYCHEESPREPRTAYGVTKCWAEDAVREAVAAGKVAGVVARPFHHDGPHQKPPGLLPELMLKLLNPQVTEVEAITLSANLETTDVRDVVRAYRLLAEKGVLGEVYNIGCGRGLFARELWELLLKVSGRQKPIRELRPETGSQNPLADIRKIQEATGWTPQIPLEVTLRDMFESLQAEGL
jgi:GDP-4-dehydro-6-deoxy-D-mannose reductase